MTVVKVTYTDDASEVQNDGFVNLDQYGYWHVEGAGESWVVKVTTVYAPTNQTATLPVVYTSRVAAVTALEALAMAAGQVLDVAAL